MNYKKNTYTYPIYPLNNDQRIGGSFLGPFILGGITGGLVTPLFFGGYNNNPPIYYYQPGPMYSNFGPRPF